MSFVANVKESLQNNEVLALALGVLLFPMIFLLPELPAQISLPALFLLVSLLGSGFLYRGLNDRKRKNIIRNTPVEPIKSATPGRTKLSGTVIPDEAVLERPFTDGVCLCAAYEIEIYRPDGQELGSNWQHETSGFISEPFLIDDGTRTARVEPGDALRIETATESTVTVTGSKADKTTRDAFQFCSYIDDERDGGDQSWSSEGEVADGIDADEFTVIPRSEHDVDVGPVGPERRFTEHVIPVGAEVSLFGKAEKSTDRFNSLTITEDESSGAFILTEQRHDGALANVYNYDSQKYIGIGAALWIIAFLIALGMAQALTLPFV